MNFHQSLFSHKPIFFPVGRIAGNVLLNACKRFAVADNVIVETGLHRKLIEGSNNRAFFVTADLYDLITVETEPGFGEIRDICNFLLRWIGSGVIVFGWIEIGIVAMGFGVVAMGLEPR